MPASKLDEWDDHFHKFPTGDYHAQLLLVDLIMTVEGCFLSTFGNGKVKPRRPSQIAPWLVPMLYPNGEPDPDEEKSLQDDGLTDNFDATMAQRDMEKFAEMDEADWAVK